jgi:hypothetical protein
MPIHTKERSRLNWLNMSIDYLALPGHGHTWPDRLVGEGVEQAAQEELVFEALAKLSSRLTGAISGVESHT